MLYMERICYNCQKDLQNEPAVESLRGLLCFPCRYNFDKIGGEKFILDHPNYNIEKEHWNQKYGTQWKRYQRLNKCRDIAGWVYGISVVSCIFGGLIALRLGGDYRLVLLGLLMIPGVPLLGIIFMFVDKYRCPSPPPAPPNALKSNPKVIFSPKFSIRTKDTKYKYGYFRNRYPMDWDEIRKKCSERDRYACRICGASISLQIHHIIPISQGGPHCLQNLITLCGRCHQEQQYYKHEKLIQLAKLFKGKL